jgi:sulfopyruvate decarboxylase subunit alpha
MDAHAVWQTLKSRGFTFFAGVPDSTLSPLFEAMASDPELRYIPAVREDTALGIASAAPLMGRRGGVLMQNSGLGNIVNALTSFSLLYELPVLLIVGWRGYGGPPNDAPEHWAMGAKTAGLLELLGLPYEVLEAEGLNSSLDRLTTVMDQRSVPGALLVRHGTIT